MENEIIEIRKKVYEYGRELNFKNAGCSLYLKEKEPWNNAKTEILLNLSGMGSATVKKTKERLNLIMEATEKVEKWNKQLERLEKQ